VCSLVTLVGTLLVVSHASGKQAQSIADLKEDMAENKKEIEAHNGQLTRHEKEIGQLQTAMWPETWHHV
jgi:chromosome segregation ATPase